MTEMVIQQLLLDAGADDVDQDLVTVEPAGARGGGRLADAAVARDVPRIRPEQRLRLARRAPRSTSRTRTRARALPPQLLGARRDVDGRATRRGAQRAGRPDRVPFHARDVNLVMGPATAGARSRSGSSSTASRPGPRRDRRGRRRLRDRRRQRTYQLIRQPGAIAERAVRDRVPRRRRRGVLLHVRLMATPRAWFPPAPDFGATRLFRARRCSTFGPPSR